jgi:hypothetical protein
MSFAKVDAYSHEKDRSFPFKKTGRDPVLIFTKNRYE